MTPDRRREITREAMRRYYRAKVERGECAASGCKQRAKAGKKHCKKHCTRKGRGL